MVVTRFAPSPTGFLHSGNYRTALFAYLYAKKHQGRFLVRIEDTDKARSKPEFEKDILYTLKWLDLNFEGEIYRDSDKTDLHKKYLQNLIDKGFAYISTEKEGDRKEVIRFKNPNKKVKFQDLIRGDIEIDTTDLGDFVIAKSLEEPVFHLSVVIDDHEMGITHVVRGEDHISNTPRQILIQQAIGAKQPIYAHLPLILDKDRSKLSKRKGAKSITDYRNAGYKKEAIINYLALLGWNSGTEQELFTLKQLEKEFSLEKVNKSAAVFDENKLKWFNKQYGVEYLKDELEPLKEKPSYSKELLNWKEKPANKNLLEETKKLVESVTDFTKENIKTTLWPLAEKEGKGEVLWPLRIALSGKEKSPDPFTIAELIGKEESLNRINHAISLL